MKIRSQKQSIQGSKAFTLVEMMVVIAIIGILTSLAIPMLQSPGRALELKSSADNLKNGIQLARQEAVTFNGSMEIRFYQKSATDPFTAYQIYTIDADGNKLPYNKLQVLPQGLIFSSKDQLSTLLANASALKGTKGTQLDGASAVKNWIYSSVIIGPSGTFTDVPQDDAFITVMESAAPIVTDNLPKNYAMVKVQPLTGMVSIVQP